MVKIVTGLFSAFSLLQLIKMNWASPENNINVVKANGELTGNPCQRPNFVGRKIPTPDLWLKSAQLLAFCYEQYGTLRSSDKTKQQKVCLPGNCKSCLSACTMSDYEDRKGCWDHCVGINKDACRRGCSFYLKMYGINSTDSVGGSSTNLPVSSIVPQIAKTFYNYTTIMWTTPFRSSLTIFVIFARDHYTDSGNIGVFKPINMTMRRKINITATNICHHYSGMNLHLGVKFAYDIVSVSMHGYNYSALLSNSKHRTKKGFRKIDYISDVNVASNGTLEVIPRSIRVTYKVSWNFSSALSKYVNYVEASDRISGCYSGAAFDHPRIVAKLARTTNQDINLPDLWLKMCNFTFTVIPYVSCLPGVPQSKTIFYPGCHIFPNAPSGCVNLPSTPTSAPITIASIWKESFDCITFKCPSCPVNGSSDFCECLVGTYNTTFNWSVSDTSIFGILQIECELFEKFSTSVGVLLIRKRRRVLDKNARSLFLTGLEFGKNYSFKVFLRTSDSQLPLMSSIPGLDFKRTGVPFLVITTSPRSNSAAVSTSSTTTETTASTVVKSGPIASAGLNTALTAGLAVLAFIAVIIVFLLVIIYERRRRRRNAKEKLGFNELGSVSFEAHPPDHWELLMDSIVFGEALGEGAFGKVYVATVSGVTLRCSSTSYDSSDKYVKMGSNRAASFTGSSVTMKAAVKVLQDNFSAQQKSDFLEEINLMKDVGQHKNIINMLGCVTRGPNLCLVVEFMPYGDLLHFLRGRRSKILGKPSYIDPLLSFPNYVQSDSFQHKSSQSLVPPSPVSNEESFSRANVSTKGGRMSVDDETISPDDLLRISWQIASGMEYLSQKGFVHRDLAARNVLVGSNKLCKISDFGLTRLVYEEKVYMGRKSRKLPIKWMSIEAIIDQRFTTYSDVWSFGVLLFEIVTLGGTPYPTMNGQELLRFLRAGQRMEKPENCSAEIFTVMKACWLTNPFIRPTFTDIRERFETLISEGTPYVEFDLDNCSPYYNVPSFISIEESTDDSLSDDLEEDESDWEKRFRSLDLGGFSSSPGERYATGDGNSWLSPGTADVGCLPIGKEALESTGSGASTTPLADGILQARIEGNNTAFLKKGDSSPSGSVQRPKHYQWEGGKPRNNGKLPSTPSVNAENKEVFVIDNFKVVE